MRVGIELYQWGWVDGKILYLDMYYQSHLPWANRMVGWPESVSYFANSRMIYLANQQDYDEKGSALMLQCVNGEVDHIKEREIWEGYRRKMLAYEQKIWEGLSDFSDKELTYSFEVFYEDYIDFWQYAFLPEVANVGAEHLIQEYLKKHHPDHLDIFEDLCAPTKLSFFQIEEKEFLEIVIEQKRDLAQHQRKYYWLKNNYGSQKILDVDYFEKGYDKWSVEDAKKQLKKIEKYPLEAQRRRDEAIKKYEIDEKIIKISELVREFLLWQDQRKKHVFICCQLVNFFVKEIAKRHSMDPADLECYRIEEIKELLQKGKKIDIKARKSGYIVAYEPKKLSYLEGERAKKTVEQFLNAELPSELKGIVVSKAQKQQVQGKVRVLNSPDEAKDLQEGEILVAAMTAAEFVFAMKKARAILTDAGGMTSHAAVVSRELGVACIVGAKTATKQLKTGDSIVMDMKTGVVQKIDE